MANELQSGFPKGVRRLPGEGPTENLICPYCGHSHPFEDGMETRGKRFCRGCDKEFMFETHWDAPTFTSIKKEDYYRNLRVRDSRIVDDDEEV